MPRIRCECKRLLSYPPELAGKVVKCPGCSAKIRLPQAEPAAPPARAAPEEGQELQLERDETDIPAASSAPASDGTTPSGISLPPYEPPTWAAARRSATATSDPAAAAQDYWGALPGAFGFPLKGEGFIALIVGVIFLTVVHYLVSIASVSLSGILLGGIVYIIGTGYFAGYLMTIIERTAHDKNDAPGWPDLDDWQENALKPFAFILALSILCIGPSVAYRHFAREPNEALAQALLAAGLFYMPMGVLCVALANDYAGLNPVPVIRAIRSVPGRYSIVWLLVMFCITAQRMGAGLVAELPIPILGTILQQAVSCYFLFVAARILGLLYSKSGRQLNWLAG
jgi:hypothetical protein